MMSIASSLILVVYALIFDRRSLILNGRQLFNIFIQTSCGAIIAAFCFFSSLNYIDASVTTLIFFTSPALVMLFDRIFFKAKFRILNYLAVAAVLTGAALVVKPGHIEVLNPSEFKGLLFAAAASFGSAFSNIYSQKVMQTVSPFSLLIYNNVIESVLFISAMLIFPVTLAAENIDLVRLIPVVVFLALVSWLFPYLFLLKGIRFIGASRASLVSTSELPLTLLFAFMFLGDRMSLLQLGGAVLITAGIITGSRVSHQH